jgi:hypothetical protein
MKRDRMNLTAGLGRASLLGHHPGEPVAQRLSVKHPIAGLKKTRQATSLANGLTA